MAVESRIAKPQRSPLDVLKYSAQKALGESRIAANTLPPVLCTRVCESCAAVPLPLLQPAAFQAPWRWACKVRRVPPPCQPCHCHPALPPPLSPLTVTSLMWMRTIMNYQVCYVMYRAFRASRSPRCATRQRETFEIGMPRVSVPARLAVPPRHLDESRRAHAVRGWRHSAILQGLPARADPGAALVPHGVRVCVRVRGLGMWPVRSRASVCVHVCGLVPSCAGESCCVGGIPVVCLSVSCVRLRVCLCVLVFE